MAFWRRARRSDSTGPEGIALRVRNRPPKARAEAADLRSGRTPDPSGNAIPRILLWGVLLATAFYLIAHLSVVSGVWPIHGTSGAPIFALVRNGVALLAWLALFPVLRLLGFRGNWAVVALPVIIFLLIRPSLFQVFTDPAYQATRATRAEANALKAERSQLTTILRAYEGDRLAVVFPEAPPPAPNPWAAAQSAERSERTTPVRWASYLAPFLAPLALLLGFLASRRTAYLRIFREHRSWPFLPTLGIFFILTMFFTELGKVGGTTPWELFLPIFILVWATVLADDSYNLARPEAIMAPRRIVGLLLYGAVPIVPFLIIRELGLSVVFAGSLAVMLLVGTRRSWWAGLMMVVWTVLVIAAFSLDDRSATRLALAYEPYRDLTQMTSEQAERWAASVHQIKLFDANVLAGGLWGQGPGRGHAETAPNAADDGYITMVAAQYGLLGTLSLVAIYTLFLIQMLSVAVRERGAFERSAATGLALLIAIPFWLATLGGLRLIPLTGVAAAFAAHGGAKLLAASLSVGIIAGLSHRRAEEDRLTQGEAARELPDHGVRVV
jgi:cell division protein FtsW (lipid II flippase)